MAMDNDAATLEKAAKYICNTLDGLCPMAAERYACPTDCTLDTIPWKCWISYFREQRDASEPMENNLAGPRPLPPFNSFLAPLMDFLWPKKL